MTDHRAAEGRVNTSNYLIINIDTALDLLPSNNAGPHRFCATAYYPGEPRGDIHARRTTFVQANQQGSKAAERADLQHGLPTAAANDITSPRWRTSGVELNKGPSHRSRNWSSNSGNSSNSSNSLSSRLGLRSLTVDQSSSNPRREDCIFRKIVSVPYDPGQQLLIVEIYEADSTSQPRSQLAALERLSQDQEQDQELGDSRRLRKLPGDLRASQEACKCSQREFANAKACVAVQPKEAADQLIGRATLTLADLKSESTSFWPLIQDKALTGLPVELTVRQTKVEDLCTSAKNCDDKSTNGKLCLSVQLPPLLTAQ